MPENILKLEKLTKKFKTERGPVTAVDTVDLDIVGDEFFTLLGPSGCGKTTTLRMIAGLESITSGSISFNGKDFTSLASSRRNIGMVFQSYALFPHLTVFDNAAYGLHVRRTSKADVEARVGRTLDMLGLKHLAGRYPADLSGGQQQRVSVARALVYDPGILLLDEPLANLDAKLRVEMREEIRRIQKELGIMTIFVTHDQEEAMSVSDRLAVFNFGKVIQIGAGADIYRDPQSLFVADFIGKANFLPAHVSNRNGAGAAATLTDGQEMHFEKVYPLAAEEGALLANGFDGMVMVRPEHVDLTTDKGKGLPCHIRRIQFLGSFVRYVAASENTERDLIIDTRGIVPGLEEGSKARIGVQKDQAHLFQKGTA